MGSKKNKSNRSKTGNRQISESSRKALPDMSKYAGATSNKSKRDYSETSTRNLNTKKASKSNSAYKAKKNTQTASAKSSKYVKAIDAEIKSSTDTMKTLDPLAEDIFGTGESAPKKKSPKKKSVGKKTTEKAAKDKSKARTKKTAHKEQSKSKAKEQSKPKAKPVRADYTEDEYSKALSSNDFYSSIIEKYYMKHPEEKRISSYKHSTANKAKAAKPKKEKNTSASSYLISIAEMAVKGRGTKDKEKHARVVKNGKATGRVSSQAAHRMVRQRNRRRSVVANAFILMMVFIFLIAAYATVFFNVKQIKVVGTSPYTESQILSNCNFNKGENILFIDAAGSIRQINEKLPYVEKCTVTRKLPATIVVDISEAHILGLVNLNENMWVLLSTQGKILDLMTNSATVSASDMIRSVTYSENLDLIRDKALEQGIPILNGLDLKHVLNDGRLNDEDLTLIDDIVMINECSIEQKLPLSGVTIDEKGYSVVYDNRITIVLGEKADKKTVEKCFKKAYYILIQSGDVTEHEHGVITYLKNETFYTPSYESDDTVKV